MLLEKWEREETFAPVEKDEYGNYEPKTYHNSLGYYDEDGNFVINSHLYNKDDIKVIMHRMSQAHPNCMECFTIQTKSKVFLHDELVPICRKLFLYKRGYANPKDGNIDTSYTPKREYSRAAYIPEIFSFYRDENNLPAFYVREEVRLGGIIPCNFFTMYFRNFCEYTLKTLPTLQFVMNVIGNLAIIPAGLYLFNPHSGILNIIPITDDMLNDATKFFKLSKVNRDYFGGTHIHYFNGEGDLCESRDTALHVVLSDAFESSMDKTDVEYVLEGKAEKLFEAYDGKGIYLWDTDHYIYIKNSMWTPENVEKILNV